VNAKHGFSGILGGSGGGAAGGGGASGGGGAASAGAGCGGVGLAGAAGRPAEESCFLSIAAVLWPLGSGTAFFSGSLLLCFGGLALLLFALLLDLSDVFTFLSLLRDRFAATFAFLREPLDEARLRAATFAGFREGLEEAPLRGFRLDGDLARSFRCPLEAWVKAL